MAAVGNSLIQLVAELYSLIRHTARTIARLWAPLLALMLLGWATHQVSILIATEVSTVWPWGVIVVLAVGAVIQLATIVAVLRLVAVDLGIPKMLASASLREAVSDERDTSLVALLTITVLPFLGMYVAFGYLQSYAAELAIVASYRKGIGDLLGALNPLESSTTMVVMLVLLATGYLFKKLIDPWLERSRYPLLLGMVQIVVEACLALLVLLGGFRVYQAFDLWLSGRRVAAWWDQLIAVILGPIPDAVQELAASAWTTIGGPFWTLGVNGLLRPLLWLAMAGLVFGSRVLTMADLWRVGEPVTEVSTRRERLLARLQSESETAQGVRVLVLKVQSELWGGVDGTIIPAWQSLRLVLRAGWPFVGAFIIGFTVLEVAGQQVDLWIARLIGGQLVGVWVRLNPFLDLVQMVLVMGITWVFLGVAYTRALSIFAARAGDGVTPVLTPDAPNPTRAVRARWVSALAIILVTVLVVTGAAQLPSKLDSDVVHAGVLKAVDLHEQRVAAAAPEFAKAITIRGRTVTTNQIFVVVTVMVSNPGPHADKVTAHFVSGSASYPAWGTGTPVAPPGFRVAQDVVFEVDPARVAGGHLSFSAMGESILLTGYQKTVDIDLEITPDAVATAHDVLEVYDLPDREAA